MNKKVLIIVATILSAAMLFGCDTNKGSHVQTTEQEPIKVSESVEGLETSNNESIKDKDVKDKNIETGSLSFLISDKKGQDEHSDVSEDLQKQFISLYKEITSGKPLLIKADTQNYLYSVSAKNDSVEYDIKKCSNDYEYFFLIGDTCYPVNDKMDKLINSINGNENPEKSPENRIISSQYKCSEPVTNEQYIKAAQGAVAVWLDSLKNETGEYKLESYDFEDEYAESVFLAAGYVGGVKEFAVEVCFGVDGISKDSVFESPGSSYNKFYHYYDGPCVFVRCKWENGKCIIINYDEAFMPDITENLYGINANSSKYETFYDFMNDEDSVKNYLLKNASRSSDIVISHNVAMISDGKIFYIDIDCDSYEELENGKISGKMGDNFYDVNGKPCYSSPVRYDEANMCPYKISFTKDFRLVFDDYNCDGNADYTIKYDEDEKGSHYSVSCLANDGSPRAGGQDIYMAGSFDDSIMLQKLSGDTFLCWDIDDKTGKMTPVANGEQADKNILKNGIDKYRMYSQRYYLPEHMKIYSENTSKIICYFWNNTDKDVSAGGKYYVEKLSDGTWKKVLDGKSVQNQNVKAYSFAKLAFDVADISDSAFSEYRIVMNIGGEKVYGGFFMGSKNSPKISIKTTKENLPDNRTNINFDITNEGMFTVNLCEAELLKDEKKICNIDISSTVGDINPNATKTLTVTDKIAGGIFAAGKYTINIICGGSKFSGTVSLVNVPDENRYYFGGKPIVDKTKNGYDIKIQNKIWSKTSAEISECGLIYVLKDNKWLLTDLMYEKMLLDYGDSEITEKIPYNNELHMEYTHILDYYVNSEEIKSYYNEFMSSLDEMLKEECISQDEYQFFKDMSYEDFICYQFGFSNETISSGDLCRIEVGIGDSAEYIYFTAP